MFTLREMAGNQQSVCTACSLSAALPWVYIPCSNLPHVPQETGTQGAYHSTVYQQKSGNNVSALLREMDTETYTSWWLRLPWWLREERVSPQCGDLGLIPGLGRSPGGWHGKNNRMISVRFQGKPFMSQKSMSMPQPLMPKKLKLNNSMKN